MPTGPACHTGERSCFHDGDLEPTPSEALAALERTIAERKASGGAGSYTAELLADPARDRGEGGGGGRGGDARRRPESDQRVREEAADVLYHLTVLLASRDLSLADAFEELNARRR